MASKLLQPLRAAPFILGLSTFVFIVAWPAATSAHQLNSASGVAHGFQHSHVIKRNTYGNGFVAGHRAPTRHGNGMIIWSPAPNNQYGSLAPTMRIPNPSRIRPPRRATRNNIYIQQSTRKNRGR